MSVLVATAKRCSPRSTTDVIETSPLPPIAQSISCRGHAAPRGRRVARARGRHPGERGRRRQHVRRDRLRRRGGGAGGGEPWHIRWRSRTGPNPRQNPLGEAAAFCDSTGGWLPLACTLNCTSATEWVRQLFAMDGRRSTRLFATGGGLGPRSPPYLSGERTPNLPRAGGVFVGLRPSHGRAMRSFVRRRKASRSGLHTPRRPAPRGRRTDGSDAHRWRVGVGRMGAALR